MLTFLNLIKSLFDLIWDKIRRWEDDENVTKSKQYLKSRDYEIQMSTVLSGKW